MERLVVSVEASGGGRPRKRPRRAAEERPRGRVKASVLLSAAAHQRLGVHATMSGRSASDLVEELILRHLTRYRVADMGDRGGEGQGGEPPELRVAG